MSIFKQSRAGRAAYSQIPKVTNMALGLDDADIRTDQLQLPEVSELEVVRHFTKLSQKNFSIDGQFYPLGSCTMKYNPKGVHHLASQSKLLNQHPLTPEKHIQGFLQCLYELQDYLAAITGMQGVSLSPMAGAQGELAGVAMIKAYHQANNDHARVEILVPDSAHGTNPASAVMCGYKIKEIATNAEGDLDLTALKAALGPHTAGIMLTNPSTMGLFERNITKVAKMVHEAGGLLYYDGANLNAILGQSKPGDMGFDVMHLNLHKTFATPHGGGGPGCGPVAVNNKLLPFLPVPRVGFDSLASVPYHWLTDKHCPQSIGRLSAFAGNAGILMRAYLYIRLLGNKGLKRVSEFATLNANYLQSKLAKNGLELPFPNRRASHEFMLTLQNLKKAHKVTAMDVAKRLLDYDCHAPTTYFPLGVPECFLIEPTETEAKWELDNFVDALTKIVTESKSDPEMVKNSPYSCPVGRIDEVKAARALELTYADTLLK